jgi:hypothetical protein
MKLYIEKIENGWIVTFEGDHMRSSRKYVYNGIENLQADLPKFFRKEADMKLTEQFFGQPE